MGLILKALDFCHIDGCRHNNTLAHLWSKCHPNIYKVLCQISYFVLESYTATRWRHTNASDVGSHKPTAWCYWLRAVLITGLGRWHFHTVGMGTECSCLPSSPPALSFFFFPSVDWSREQAVKLTVSRPRLPAWLLINADVIIIKAA